MLGYHKRCRSSHPLFVGKHVTLGGVELVVCFCLSQISVGGHKLMLVTDILIRVSGFAVFMPLR